MFLLIPGGGFWAENGPREPQNEQERAEKVVSEPRAPRDGLELYRWDGEDSGWSPSLGLNSLAASDAGGTEEPETARGSRLELKGGFSYRHESLDAGLEIHGASLFQDSLVERSTKSGVYAGYFWLGSPYITWPRPGPEAQWWLRAGYQPMLSDEMGLLYHRTAPAVSLGAQIGSGGGPILGLQFHAMDLSDSEPYFGPSYRTGQARFYNGEFSLYIGGWMLELSYGNYRMNGRSALPSAAFQGFQLWEGQRALPAQFVHYSGLAVSKRTSDWRLDFQAYQSHGQQSARTAYGGEEYLSKKSIRGWLAAFQLLWFPDGTNWELGLAGLGSSRQRKDGEDFLGFAPLNPWPRILGGYASLLLSSRPPFDQSHPFSNRRYQESFPSGHESNNGRNLDLKDIPTHRIVVPDHGNRGIRMGGMHFYRTLNLICESCSYAGMYLNRAEFKDSQGTEGILILAHRTNYGTIILSAAGAYITPAAEAPDPFTGLIPSSRRRFFSRYAFSFETIF